MAAVVGNGVTLYEWATKPYLRFMKVKSYWLPEAPRFIRLSHDGARLRNFLLGYGPETDIIDVETAQVTEYPVNDAFKNECNQKAKAKWTLIEQIKFPQAATASVVSTLRPRTVNRKLAAAVPKVIDQPDPNIFPPRRYLATLNKMTQVLNSSGKAAGIPPNDSECAKLQWHEPPVQVVMYPEDGQGACHVLAYEKTHIELKSLTTGNTQQSIKLPFEKLKFLTYHDGCVFGVSTTGKTSYVHCVNIKSGIAEQT